MIAKSCVGVRLGWHWQFLLPVLPRRWNSTIALASKPSPHDYNPVMHALLLATLLTLAAVPPLTDEQRAQLDTATDNDKQVDQAGLYPLLQNALEWKPGDESGAAVPDYVAILDAPADAR